jgi:hypothetical protein
MYTLFIILAGQQVSNNNEIEIVKNFVHPLREMREPLMTCA